MKYEPGDGCELFNAPAALISDNPTKKPNDFNWEKTAKTRWSGGIIGPRSVIHAELIAGREWQEVVSAGGVKSFVSRLAKPALKI
jgi:hypothetical protein